MVNLCSRHPRSRAVGAGNAIHALSVGDPRALVFYLTFYIKSLTNISTKRAVLQYGLETKKSVNDKELPECFLASGKFTSRPSCLTFHGVKSQLVRHLIDHEN